jgi:hypothetical protein
MALFGKAWLHMVDAMDEVSLLFDNYIHNISITISIIYPQYIHNTICFRVLILECFGSKIRSLGGDATRFAASIFSLLWDESPNFLRNFQGSISIQNGELILALRCQKPMGWNRWIGATYHSFDEKKQA